MIYRGWICFIHSHPFTPATVDNCVFMHFIYPKSRFNPFDPSPNFRGGERNTFHLPDKASHSHFWSKFAQTCCHTPPCRVPKTQVEVTEEILTTSTLPSPAWGEKRDRKGPGETGGCLILHFRGNGIVYRRWINTGASWFCSAGDGGTAEGSRCWKWYSQLCLQPLWVSLGRPSVSQLLFHHSAFLPHCISKPWQSVFLQNITFNCGVSFFCYVFVLIYSNKPLFCGGHRNLPTIMSWVQAQRPGADGVNIITSDFVELTDFANIVIRLNDLLLSEQGAKSRWHKTHNVVLSDFYFFLLL